MRANSAGRRLVRELSVHDWILATYFALLLLALAFAAPAPNRVPTLAILIVLAGTAGLCVVGVRARRRRSGMIAAIVYRVAVVGSLLGSYFLLRDILPIVNDAAYDRTLRAIDVAMFGTDPVLWLDRFVAPATTEWFAFSYYCYFLLLAGYLLPMLASRRPRLQNELGLGIFGTFVIAHLTYIVVPGFGPYRAFGDLFTTALPDGYWMRTIERAVESRGALKDIFPSLHTAAPVFLLSFAFRHRRERPFGAVWQPTAFIVINIVAGAVFLRWHYVIDIVAGLALGCAAAAAAPIVARWELRRRARIGAGAVWPNA